jgi:hypothetical protein
MDRVWTTQTDTTANDAKGVSDEEPVEEVVPFVRFRFLEKTEIESKPV